MLTPLAWDTETAPIEPAQQAPPLACVTWQTPGEEPGIVDRQSAEPLLRSWLADPTKLLVAHNGAYDFGVICEAFPALRPLVFKAYEDNRVTDTMLRQQLIDNAAGRLGGYFTSAGKRISYRYDLETLAERCAGMKLQKDHLRLMYGRFLDAPLSKWPERLAQIQAEERPRADALRAEVFSMRPSDPRRKALMKELESLESMLDSDPEQCIKYPLDDARAALAVFLAQESFREYLDDQFRQARAYFALGLSKAWGLRTDEAGVALLRSEVEAELEEVRTELIAAGLVRPDGSRDTKVAKRRMISVCSVAGFVIPRTDAHMKDDAKCGGADDCDEHVCLDAEACGDSEDHLLQQYARLTTLTKVLSNDINALEGGTRKPIHTRYGFAATGRTTSSK